MKPHRYGPKTIRRMPLHLRPLARSVNELERVAAAIRQHIQREIERDAAPHMTPEELQAATVNARGSETRDRGAIADMDAQEYAMTGLDTADQQDAEDAAELLSDREAERIFDVHPDDHREARGGRRDTDKHAGGTE